MATTTMRLGLLLMTALAIIHISKAEPEKEDESQIEQKSEGNMMASSMEEVELRSVREADNQKKKNQKKKGKTTNAKKSRRQKKKKNTKRQRKNKPRKSGRRKTGGRKGRKNSPNIPRRKKNKNGASKKMRFRKKKDKKLKKKKDKKLKKKKRTKKVRKNGRKNDGGMSVRQICDETALCQKIKDYIKYSNQLRKVKRIVKSCDTMEKKANKSVTEFDATVAALDEVIASNAKRRLYIRWRRTQRSTDEVVAIRDNLKNCSVSVKAKCEKKVQPACLEIVLLTECEALLQAWLNEFGPKTGSCLQASADCCACITGLGSVDAKCLDFDTKSTAAVKSKKTCTGSGTGAFGFCRKQQQEAAVKGPPAAQEACSGGTATKAPAAATTAAAGATTAAAAATTAAAQGATTAAAEATTAAAAATTAGPTGSCPVKCGVKKQGTKIVGGTEATVNEWPWMAALSMGCGGSVVADKWIVTAAHCFFNTDGTPKITNNNIEQVVVTIGDHDNLVSTETTLEKTVTANFMILHPQYVYATNLNDIALLRIPAIDLKVYTPVCLPTQGANYDGKKAWVYGWGALSSGGSSPTKLQELELVIVSDASAKQSYQSVAQESLSDAQLAAMVFAGGEEGKDGCQGDSGGPFTYGNPDNNGQHELVGAVSWGLGCAAAGLPGAYAEVSAFRTWIDEEIKKNGGAVFTC